MKRVIVKLLFVSVMLSVMNHSANCNPPKEAFHNPFRGYFAFERKIVLAACLYSIVHLFELAVATHAEGLAVIRDRYSNEFLGTTIFHLARIARRHFAQPVVNDVDRIGTNTNITSYVHNHLDIHFSSLLNTMQDISISVFIVQLLLGVYRRRGDLSFWQKLINRYVYKPLLPTVQKRLGITYQGSFENQLHDCLICLEEGFPAQEGWIVPCSTKENHVFHKECIEGYLKSIPTGACPSCRGELLLSDNKRWFFIVLKDLFLHEPKYCAFFLLMLASGYGGYRLLRTELTLLLKKGLSPLISILCYLRSRYVQGKNAVSNYSWFKQLASGKGNDLPTINTILEKY